MTQEIIDIGSYRATLTSDADSVCVAIVDFDDGEVWRAVVPDLARAREYARRFMAFDTPIPTRGGAL